MYPDTEHLPHFTLVLLLAILVSTPVHFASARRIGVELGPVFRFLTVCILCAFRPIVIADFG